MRSESEIKAQIEYLNHRWKSYEQLPLSTWRINAMDCVNEQIELLQWVLGAE